MNDERSESSVFAAFMQYQAPGENFRFFSAKLFIFSSSLQSWLEVTLMEKCGNIKYHVTSCVYRVAPFYFILGFKFT